MKERGKSKSSKRSDNEESGELSSSSSSSQSASSSIDEKRKKKMTKKLSKPAEEGEIESDSESKGSKTKTVDNTSSKLQSVRKLIDRTKSEYETAQHKLEKIERAYKKAESEKNKVNMKKCIKYKEKYALKVDKLKDNLKIYQAKKVKIANELRSSSQATTPTPTATVSATVSSQSQKTKLSKTSPVQSNKRKEIVKEKDEQGENAKMKRQRLSPNPTKTKTVSTDLSQQAKSSDHSTKTGGETTSAKAPIKIPFPVLNDKRNIKVILGTLETKRNELIKKHDQCLQTLKMLTKKGAEKLDDKVDKLRQMDQALESQRDKIEKQLDYIRLSLSLDSLRSRTGNNPTLIIQNKHAIDQMTGQLNDMYNYMKQENMIAIKKHQEQADAEAAAAEEEAAKKKSAEKLTTLYDQVNNSLAALLAHIAATAHAAASCAASSHFYASYYQQNLPEGHKIPIEHIHPPAPVPIKTQLAKASTTFASLKDRISNFFITSKKQEAVIKEEKSPDIKENSEKNSGLNLLMCNYGDDEDEMPEETPVIIESEQANDSSSNDSEDSDSELEIVTTSEIKSAFQNRNYLMPSLKASYFPLKASLSSDWNRSAYKQLSHDPSRPKLNDILFK